MNNDLENIIADIDRRLKRLEDAVFIVDDIPNPSVIHTEDHTLLRKEWKNSLEKRRFPKYNVDPELLDTIQKLAHHKVELSDKVKVLTESINRLAFDRDASRQRVEVLEMDLVDVVIFLKKLQQLNCYPIPKTVIDLIDKLQRVL